MKIYFAGSLFNTAEKNFNSQLSEILKKSNKAYNIILPQEQANEIAGDKDFENKVFNYCVKGVIQSDVILAILDGPDVDSGTCIELGIAKANNKKIVGIRTDIRGSEFEGLNIMVRKVLDYCIYQPNDKNTIEELAKEINFILDKI